MWSQLGEISLKSRLNDSFGSFGVRERSIINETRGTTLHYTTLHYTTLHYTTLHYATLHCTILCATLYYTCLYFWPDQPCNYFQGKKHTTLHYTTLHYTTLHYTTLASVSGKTNPETVSRATNTREMSERRSGTRNYGPF